MCPDCIYEYAKIFDGYANKQERNKIGNAEFEAFKMGWEKTESAMGFRPMEIPPQVQYYYDKLLFFNKSEKQVQKEIIDIIKNNKNRNNNGISQNP